VRSIAAHLAGDEIAADEVQLVLPETGVCSSTNALSDEEIAAGVAALGGCCDPAHEAEAVRSDRAVVLAKVTSDPALQASLRTVRLGFATGVPNGRAGDAAEAADAAESTGSPLALTDVSAGRSGGCCG
jgi:hypothetical protein